MEEKQENRILGEESIPRLLLNVMNSMIRADGSPTFAMAAMLVGAITNIVLDPVFIFLLKWGIAGAAWATVIGQVASFLMCAVYLFRPKSFKLTKKSFLPDGRIHRPQGLHGADLQLRQGA